MNPPSVCAIVPVKVDSRRLPNKNFLMLGGKPLAHYIFETLLSLDEVEVVYAFCSDPRLVNLLPSGVKWLPRSAALDSDDIGANLLFRSAVEAVSNEIVLLAQIPGPFLRKETILEAIDSIKSDCFDSVTTVVRNQTYAWYQGHPLNYDPKKIKQTQIIDPVFMETSGLYAFKRQMYLSEDTRILGRVKQIEVNQLEGLDIDEPSHFMLAEQFVNLKQRSELENTKHEVYGKLLTLGKIRHLVFDLDGVLIDSLNIMRAAWNSAMFKSGMEIDFNSYKKHIGLPFHVILENLGIPNSKFDEIKTYYDEESVKSIDKIQIYEGVNPGLQQLKNVGFKLSIFTSKDKKRTKQIVDLYFPATFDCVVTPEDLAPNRGKPAPDGILLSCLKNQSSPNETIYVGDMKVDSMAAHEAGVTFVYASWGYGDELNSSNIWFDRFSSLGDWLVGLAAQDSWKFR